jgi:hypothetical protein
MTEQFRHHLELRTADLVRNGVATGCLLTGALVWMITGGRAAASDGGLLIAWGIGMIAVCALACIGPTVRALRVQPREALSAEG